MSSTTRQPLQRPKHGIENQLQSIIESRGLTAYALGQLAHVDPGVIQRFLNGERDLRFATVGKITAALGVRLVEVATRRAPSRRPRRGPATTPVRGI